MAFGIFKRTVHNIFRKSTNQQAGSSDELVGKKLQNDYSHPIEPVVPSF